MTGYDYQHVVGLEDTNVVGNVYFAKYISWQGRCREAFLLEKCRDVLDELKSGLLHLVTRQCECTYTKELFAGDVVLVRMRLARRTHSRMWLTFEYIRVNDQTSEVIAHGAQVIGCLRRNDGAASFRPAELPASLVAAIAPYEQSVARPSEIRS